MGCGLGTLRLPRHRKQLVSTRLEVVLLSRAEADYILSDPAQRRGAYLVYEDADTRKHFLAFRSSSELPKHYQILHRNDLYYIDGFPFPYLEAIICYYQRHRFKGTLLTEPAFAHPYVTTHRKPSRCPPSPHHQSGTLPKTKDDRDSLNRGRYRSVKTL